MIVKTKQNRHKDQDVHGSSTSLARLFHRDVSSKNPTTRNNIEYSSTSLTNIESNAYCDIFIYKTRRNISNKNALDFKTTNEERFYKKNKFTRLKGIQLPNYFVITITILGNIAALILLLLSSFQGFIQGFAKTQATHWAVITLKVLCLIINLFWFVTKCICRYRHGEFKIYVYQIILMYIQSLRFFIDLICILFQIATLIWPSQMTLSGVFFFFLIIVFYTGLNDAIGLEIMFADKEKNILIIQTLKIFFSNIIFGHIMASCLLAMSRINLQHNWIIQQEIQNQDWYVIYINAFYWGCTLMMTVGFGDILPVNTGQKVVMGFLEIFSCALLGYNISTIGSLISQIRAHSRRANRRRAVFRRMIRSSRSSKPYISKKLQVQILKYIQQTNDGMINMQYEQRDKIIQQLPPNLRKQYFKELCPKIFPRVKFFNQISYKTLQVLVQKFFRKSHYPMQFIIEDMTQQIVLLDLGKVGLGYKRKGSTLNSQIFDRIQMSKKHQLSLITPYMFNLGKKDNYFLVSCNHAMTWRIKYTDFIEALKQSNADYEYYFHILHSHLIDNDYLNAIKCERCSKIKGINYYQSSLKNVNQQSKQKKIKYHSVYQCPKLCYMPNREIIMLKFLKEKGLEHQRQPYYRRKRNTLSYISSLKQIHRLKKISQNEQLFQQLAQSLFQNGQFYYQVRPHRNFSKSNKQNKSSFYDRQQGGNKNQDSNQNKAGNTQKNKNEQLKPGSQTKVLKQNQLNGENPIRRQNQKLLIYTTKEQMEQVVQKVVKKYDNGGYDDQVGFWPLQSDVAYNYQFYFHDFSPCLVKNIKLNEFHPLEREDSRGVNKFNHKKYKTIKKKQWLRKLRSSVKAEFEQEPEIKDRQYVI